MKSTKPGKIQHETPKKLIRGQISFENQLQTFQYNFNKRTPPDKNVTHR